MNCKLHENTACIDLDAIFASEDEKVEVHCGGCLIREAIEHDKLLESKEQED